MRKKNSLDIQKVAFLWKVSEKTDLISNSFRERIPSSTRGFVLAKLHSCQKGLFASGAGEFLCTHRHTVELRKCVFSFV